MLTNIYIVAIFTWTGLECIEEMNYNLHYIKEASTDSTNMYGNEQAFATRLKQIMDDHIILKLNFDPKHIIKFTEFVRTAVQIINLFDDSDLKNFFKILNEEISKYDYKGSTVKELTENIGFKNYVSKMFDDLQNSPAVSIREKILDMSSYLQEDDYNEKVRHVRGVINAMYGEKSSKVFKIILDNLDGHVKRTKELDLVETIKKGVRKLLFNHYTRLDKNKKFQLKSLIETYWPNTAKTLSQSSEKLSIYMVQSTVKGNVGSTNFRRRKPIVQSFIHGNKPKSKFLQEDVPENIKNSHKQTTNRDTYRHTYLNLQYTPITTKAKDEVTSESTTVRTLHTKQRKSKSAFYTFKQMYVEKNMDLKYDPYAYDNNLTKKQIHPYEVEFETSSQYIHKVGSNSNHKMASKLTTKGKHKTSADFKERKKKTTTDFSIEKVTFEPFMTLYPEAITFPARLKLKNQNHQRTQKLTLATDFEEPVVTPDVPILSDLIVHAKISQKDLNNFILKNNNITKNDATTKERRFHSKQSAHIRIRKPKLRFNTPETIFPKSKFHFRNNDRAFTIQFPALSTLNNYFNLYKKHTTSKISSKEPIFDYTNSVEKFKDDNGEVVNRQHGGENKKITVDTKYILDKIKNLEHQLDDVKLKVDDENIFIEQFQARTEEDKYNDQFGEDDNGRKQLSQPNLDHSLNINNKNSFRSELNGDKEGNSQLHNTNNVARTIDKRITLDIQKENDSLYMAEKDLRWKFKVLHNNANIERQENTKLFKPNFGEPNATNMNTSVFNISKYMDDFFNEKIVMGAESKTLFKDLIENRNVGKPSALASKSATEEDNIDSLVNKTLQILNAKKNENITSDLLKFDNFSIYYSKF